MLNILWVIAGILLLLWVLGFSFHFTMGGLIHLLLVAVVIAVVARIFLGRRALAP